jgi:hypothetical protein
MAYCFERDAWCLFLLLCLFGPKCAIRFAVGNTSTPGTADATRYCRVNTYNLCFLKTFICRLCSRYIYVAIPSAINKWSCVLLSASTTINSQQLCPGGGTCLAAHRPFEAAAARPPASTRYVTCMTVPRRRCPQRCTYVFLCCCCGR